MPSLRFSLIALALAGAFMGVLSAPAAPGPRAVPPIHEAWVQPGTYTAFVLCTNVNTGTRRWVVQLNSREQRFPVTIGPGQTVTIPFEKGWSVKAADNAHFTSEYVPFSDLAESDLLGDPVMAIAVWGITADGPVALVAPKK
jgi:hypothetical protein